MWKARFVIYLYVCLLILPTDLFNFKKTFNTDIDIWNKVITKHPVGSLTRISDPINRALYNIKLQCTPQV